ncbi:TetR/AcrR family transcriptional regulator [Mucilaginibacter lacusdianchii]|uniref:TetR/AcrR family transcriptional regulator n=1 Tax=Mucilaginibacter lacusdianchii TaxID=2684211 RepID=UPI001E616436|nr:TetR/AcrR family transcriptional regulator [Mucilaginibacter sp. JXJ CY 39]
MEPTQQKIVEAAIFVFNDDLSATLETVADRAGVTRRTLHRYFKDRTDLMISCQSVMQKSCKEAMAKAINSSQDPLKQLELTLYASIDCGSKYSFLNKLHQRPEHHHAHENKDCAEYDNITQQWYGIIEKLQYQQIITHTLTNTWIFFLFTGMVNTAIAALNSGNVAPNDIKRFAWLSFSRSIGIEQTAESNGH